MASYGMLPGAGKFPTPLPNNIRPSSEKAANRRILLHNLLEHEPPQRAPAPAPVHHYVEPTKITPQVILHEKESANKVMDPLAMKMYVSIFGTIGGVLGGVLGSAFAAAQNGLNHLGGGAIGAAIGVAVGAAIGFFQAFLDGFSFRNGKPKTQ